MSGGPTRLIASVVLGFLGVMVNFALLRAVFGHGAETGPDARGLTMAIGCLLFTGGAGMRWGVSGALVGVGATLVIAAVTP